MAEGAVAPEDHVVAALLAQEAASPFGLKRPADELLARFGGDPADVRARATAALAEAGVVAEPALAVAESSQLVQLRQAAAPPAAEAGFPPVGDPAPLRPTSYGARLAALASGGAPTGLVAPDRRFAVGALGLGALLLLMLLVVALRAIAGDGGPRGDELPAGETAAQQQRPAPVWAVAAPPVAASPPAARRLVRLRIVPRAPTSVCVADARTGATLFDGRLAEPWSIRRRHPLILRVGRPRPAIRVNGRPLSVATAPSAQLLGFARTRPLGEGRPACG